MSTTSFNPHERHSSRVGVLRDQRVASVGLKAGKLLSLNPFSPPSGLESNSRCGECDLPDDDLVAAAQNGDQDAFVELCRRNSSMVKKRIFQIVRNREDTEDVLQDTLLRAYTHLMSFRRSCKFSTWLTTIGVNSALMVMRTRKHRRESCFSVSNQDTGQLEPQEPADRSPGPEGVYLKKQAILLVRREVEKLQPSLRSVVNHYYQSDCSLEETANTQRITLAAAKSRLMRGRVRLRASLARYGVSRSRN